MNYLSKKNFGIPATILAAISVLLGYAVFAGNFAVLWVVLAFAGIIFLFDFDDAIKTTFKQSMTVAFYGWVVKFAFSILNSILGWFSDASISSSEGVRTTYKVFGKIIDIADDLCGFVFILLFVLILLSAIKGKVAKIGVMGLNESAKETVECPKCGAKVEKGAAFCTKCGNKMQ